MEWRFDLPLRLKAFEARKYNKETHEVGFTRKVSGRQRSSMGRRLLNDIKIMPDGFDHPMDRWTKLHRSEMFFKGPKKTFWLCSQGLKQFGVFWIQNRSRCCLRSLFFLCKVYKAFIKYTSNSFGSLNNVFPHSVVPQICNTPTTGCTAKCLFCPWSKITDPPHFGHMFIEWSKPSPFSCHLASCASDQSPLVLTPYVLETTHSVRNYLLYLSCQNLNI